MTRMNEALAACQAGELDHLTRSLRDAKDIVDDLTRGEVKLSIGGSVHDPTHPGRQPLFAAKPSV